MSFLFFGAKKARKMLILFSICFLCRFFRISAAFAPNASVFLMNGRYAFVRAATYNSGGAILSAGTNVSEFALKKVWLFPNTTSNFRHLSAENGI